MFCAYYELQEEGNQMTKTTLTILTVTLVLSGASVLADSATPQGAQMRSEMMAVIGACAQANGITLPANGAPSGLSKAQNQTIHTCVNKVRDSFEHCAEAAGIQKPAPGQKPNFTTAQMTSLRQCQSQSIAQISGH
jgi:hypothetical protein